jgi:hypothetical protein
MSDLQIKKISPYSHSPGYREYIEISDNDTTVKIGWINGPPWLEVRINDKRVFLEPEVLNET